MTKYDLTRKYMHKGAKIHVIEDDATKVEDIENGKLRRLTNLKEGRDGVSALKSAGEGFLNSAKKAGEKTMQIQKDIPSRRKSFRARHNCDSPGPRHKARYWSCKAW